MSGYAKVRARGSYHAGQLWFEWECPACREWSGSSWYIDIAAEHWRECAALQRDRLLADVEAFRTRLFQRGKEEWPAKDLSVEFRHGYDVACEEASYEAADLLAKHRPGGTS